MSIKEFPHLWKSFVTGKYCIIMLNGLWTVDRVIQEKTKQFTHNSDVVCHIDSAIEVSNYVGRSDGKRGLWKTGKMEARWTVVMCFVSRCLWVHLTLCVCVLDMRERCTRLSWVITRVVKDLWCWRTPSWRRCYSTWRRTWSLFWVQKSPVSKQSRQMTALNRSKIILGSSKMSMSLQYVMTDV